MTANYLPPLTSLRVLEACARLRSFSKAAKELGVTPGAVTQHIRTIEEWVGKPLFRRTGRDILLTDVTEAALPSLREGFDRLFESARILRSSSLKHGVISVSAPPSFASKWLLPRLDRFRELHPNLEVWVAAETRLVDFHKSEVDLAIRYGPGAYEGLVVERLLSETVVPVAAPDLLQRYGPFDHPSDVLKAPLIHDVDYENDPSCPDWVMWFQARGVQTAGVLPGPRYNQSSLVIEEAVAGKGVALAKAVIAEADLQAGRLQPLFDDKTPLAFAYWLVWPRGRTILRPVRSFISWIMTAAYVESAIPQMEDEMSGA